MRQRIIILIVLSIPLFSCVKENKIIELKIQAIDYDLNKPRQNLKVELLKVKNPMFSMRSFTLIDTLKTDENGIFKCKINKKGNYSVRYYKDNYLTPVYWIDTLKVKDLNEDKFFKFSW